MNENIKQSELNYANLLALKKTAQHACRVELGGDLASAEERIEQALLRSKGVFNEVLNTDDGFYIRLILWDLEFRDAYEQLSSCGFNMNDSNAVFDVSDPIGISDDVKEDTKVHYLFYNEFDFQKVQPLLKAIFSFDLGIDPTANVSALFFDVKQSIMIYPYDDRGMEIIALDVNVIERVKAKCADYLGELY